MIIYKITNTINGKSYVGQTRVSLRVRWLQHCKPRSHCAALMSAIQKYGSKAFTAEVIYETICSLVLNYKEKQYIKEFNSLAPNGYNLTGGGEGAKHTDESKKKLSNSKLGAKNPMYGKKHTAEHKAKISAALLGRKRPQEVKDKIKANHNPISNLNLTYNRKA